MPLDTDQWCEEIENFNGFLHYFLHYFTLHEFIKIGHIIWLTLPHLAAFFPWFYEFLSITFLMLFPLVSFRILKFI